MPPRKATIAFIFTTITLDMIGLGVVIPSLPDIMRRFVSDEAQVSRYFGFFISSYAAMQFLASPLLGALSDFLGRRVVLLVSLFVAALDYLLMAFAPTLPLLFVGRVVAGLTGANLTVAWAYIADISTDENRSANFGLVGAAFGLGFIIGPAIGGVLGQWDPTLPFLFSATLCFLNFLFGLWILPESLPPEKRRAFSWAKVNPFRSLAKVFSQRALMSFLVIHFLFQLAGQVHPAIWTLYTEHRFQWTSRQVGWSLAAVGLLSAIAQGWLTRILIPKLGEIRTVRWGAAGYAVGYILYGAATEGWMMYVILLLSAVFWITPPALQSLLSRQVTPDEQGELQGTLVSLSSLASILTPLIVTQLFAYFTHVDRPNPVPGAPYYFAAGACFVGWALFSLASRDRKTVASAVNS